MLGHPQQAFDILTEQMSEYLDAEEKAEQGHADADRQARLQHLDQGAALGHREVGKEDGGGEQKGPGHQQAEDGDGEQQALVGFHAASSRVFT